MLLGGYFDDDFAIPCGIAFMELECDQPEVNFNFCKVHFCLEINFVILHCSVNLESVILAAFVANVTIFEHYWHKFDFCLIVLNHTCPLSLMTLKILLCWKFSNGIWRWQYWLSSVALTHLQNYLRCQGSTLPPYSYDSPERFVRQRDSHFYPSALRAGGILSSWSRRLLDLRDPYLCNCLTDFLHSKFCELSRPVIVHCHGHLPICPIWACPWTKNLSNLPQIGSRLCGKQISGTAGWI